MTSLFPTWIVEYRDRRPTLTAPGRGTDIKKIEVGQCATEAEAVRAVEHRVSGWCKIEAVYLGSATGF